MLKWSSPFAAASSPVVELAKAPPIALENLDLLPPRRRKNSFVASETSENADEPPPIPATHLGFHSNCGSKLGKTINQDRGVVTFPFGDKPSRMLLGVYDGHGALGHKVSEAVAFHFVEHVEGKAACTDDDQTLSTLLTDSLLATDEWLSREHAEWADTSGTTAIACILSASSCLTANVGDSRAVLGRRAAAASSATGAAGGGEAAAADAGWTAVALSTDHKCDDPDEKARLTAAGGVVAPPTAARPVATVYAGATEYGLAMSRSIGDHALGRDVVTATPSVTSTPLGEADQCLIIASDGLWDFVSAQRAVDLVHEHRGHGATRACKRLIAEATREWLEHEGEEYRDDITAIVVLLDGLFGAIASHGEALAARQAAHESWCSGSGGDRGDRFSVERRRRSTLLSAQMEHGALAAQGMAVDRLSVYYGASTLGLVPDAIQSAAERV